MKKVTVTLKTVNFDHRFQKFAHMIDAIFFFNIGLTMADIIMGQMMFGGGRMPMSPPGRGRHGCYC